VVLEEFVREVVAIADALEKEAIGAVVEKAIVAGWFYAKPHRGRIIQ
jgi:hypothetical protein